MDDPQAMDAFETSLGEQVGRYTSAATARPFDPLLAARTAMASARLTGSTLRWSTAGPSRRWWLALIPVVALIAAAIAVGANLQRRTPDVVGEPVPDSLRHTWIRPYAVTPGGDAYGSGFLTVTDRRIAYGREPGAATSSSSITATGPAALEMKATAATKSCAAGDAGAYGWKLDGEETVLTLTPISTDACRARQTALAGPWVRDFGPQPVPGRALPAGSHTTTLFDPVGDAGSPMRLAFTVPEGWDVMGEMVGSFSLQRLPDDPAGDPLAEPLIGAFTNPHVAQDFAPGAPCGPTDDMPGVGTGIDDLVEAIVTKPGVVSTPPADVTIAGHQGRLLDLRLEPGWTGGCTDLTRPLVGMPILHERESAGGAVAGLGPDQPVRLILLNVGGGRTLAIVIVTLTGSQSATFERHLAEAMPIVESFAFVPVTP